MNAKQTEDAIKVMKAYIKGAMIMVRTRSFTDKCWNSATTPSWDWSRCEYRVATEEDIEEMEKQRRFSKMKF